MSVWLKMGKLVQAGKNRLVVGCFGLSNCLSIEHRDPLAIGDLLGRRELSGQWGWPASPSVASDMSPRPSCSATQAMPRAHGHIREVMSACWRRVL